MVNSNLNKMAIPKKWYWSKGLWGGLGLLALAVAYGLGYVPESRLEKVLEIALLGFSIIGIRMAKRPIGKSE